MQLIICVPSVVDNISLSVCSLTNTSSKLVLSALLFYLKTRFSVELIVAQFFFGIVFGEFALTYNTKGGYCGNT